MHIHAHVHTYTQFYGSADSGGPALMQTTYTLHTHTTIPETYTHTWERRLYRHTLIHTQKHASTLDIQ